MSRSLYKIKYFDNSIYRLKNKKHLNIIYIYARNSSIPKYLIDKNVLIYSGLTFIKVKISADMVNLKFGDLVQTKKRGPEIHNKKKTKIK